MNKLKRLPFIYILELTAPRSGRAGGQYYPIVKTHKTEVPNTGGFFNCVETHKQAGQSKRAERSEAKQKTSWRKPLKHNHYFPQEKNTK